LCPPSSLPVVSEKSFGPRSLNESGYAFLCDASDRTDVRDCAFVAGSHTSELGDLGSVTNLNTQRFMFSRSDVPTHPFSYS